MTSCFLLNTIEEKAQVHPGDKRCHSRRAEGSFPTRSFPGLPARSLGVASKRRLRFLRARRRVRRGPAGLFRLLPVSNPIHQRSHRLHSPWRLRCDGCYLLRRHEPTESRFRCQAQDLDSVHPAPGRQEPSVGRRAAGSPRGDQFRPPGSGAGPHRNHRRGREELSLPGADNPPGRERSLAATLRIEEDRTHKAEDFEAAVLDQGRSGTVSQMERAGRTDLFVVEGLSVVSGTHPLPRGPGHPPQLPLFRLRTAADIQGRLPVSNTGPTQAPTSSS